MLCHKYGILLYEILVEEGGRSTPLRFITWNAKKHQ